MIFQCALRYKINETFISFTRYIAAVNSLGLDIIWAHTGVLKGHFLAPNKMKILDLMHLSSSESSSEFVFLMTCSMTNSKILQIKSIPGEFLYNAYYKWLVAI